MMYSNVEATFRNLKKKEMFKAVYLFIITIFYMNISNNLVFLVVIAFAIHFIVNTDWNNADWSDWGVIVLYSICLISFIFYIVTTVMLKRSNINNQK